MRKQSAVQLLQSLQVAESGDMGDETTVLWYFGGGSREEAHGDGWESSTEPLGGNGLNPGSRGTKIRTFNCF